MLTLAACGPGIHDIARPPLPVGVAPATSPAPTENGPSESPEGPAIALSEEQKMLDLINGHRAAHGLGALSFNDELNQAAQWHSDDMSQRDRLSHTDSRGRSSMGRMDHFRYVPIPGLDRMIARGENIACGNADAARTFLQWKHSRGHNANMLSKTYAEIGIGRAYRPGQRCPWYWTTDFGQRR